MQSRTTTQLNDGNRFARISIYCDSIAVEFATQFQLDRLYVYLSLFYILLSIMLMRGKGLFGHESENVQLISNVDTIVFRIKTEFLRLSRVILNI